jgi:hypothetical protein
MCRSQHRGRQDQDTLYVEAGAWERPDGLPYPYGQARYREKHPKHEP